MAIDAAKQWKIWIMLKVRHLVYKVEEYKAQCSKRGAIATNKKINKLKKKAIE
jgi:hypothetical protein